MNQGVPNIENNLKQLFDEFKFHLIYRNKQNKVTQPVSEDYKVVLEQIKQETRIKRGRKRALIESLNNLNKLQAHHSSTVKSRIWKPPTIDYTSIQSINQNLLSVQNEKEFLNSEISNLQIALVELKKNVEVMRKDVQKQTIKEEKFKHITYLTHSIDRNTDSTKIINGRTYKKMVELQDQTLSNLKKFKTALRKQNEQIQNKYNQQKSAKLIQRQHVESNEKKIREIERMNIKIDKTFIVRLEQLIELLMSKEDQFQQIKVEQTTKIRLKKIQKQYLKDDRAKMHDIIDKFEQKYDVKIQSLANLIIFIYKRLNRDNDYMQRKCINLQQIKQSLSQDYANIYKKQRVISEQQNSSRRQTATKQVQIKNKIYNNSQIFTKIIVILHNMIAKFKYLFTMALTLSKEKKNFHDLLIQIQTLYRPQQIFYREAQSEELKYQTITNINQIESICKGFSNEENNEVQWVLGLLFTDVRNSLICRKKWLEQSFKNNLSSNLAQKVQNIQSKCDQIYDSKFKIYSLILINCLKVLTMNKYEKKIVAHSNAKDSIFMSLQKQVKIYNLDECSSSENTSEYYKEHSNDTKFNSEESQQTNQQLFFASDPIKIVKALQKLKNSEKNNFRALKFQDEKVYMYDRKVIIPKFIL